MKIRAQNTPWYAGIGLLFRESDTRIAKLELIETEKGSCIEPTVVLNDQEAQELMDQLYHCGLRPTEGRGSVGQLKATQDHLNDMRSIVAKLSEVTLKES